MVFGLYNRKINNDQKSLNNTHLTMKFHVFLRKFHVRSLLPVKSLHFLTRICFSSSSGKGWQDVKFCRMNTCRGCDSAKFGQVRTIGAKHTFDHAKYVQLFYQA